MSTRGPIFAQAQARTDLIIELQEVSRDQAARLKMATDLEFAIIDKKRQLKDLRDDLLLAEATVRQDVLSNKDLTNEAQRRAALDHRLLTDQVAKDARNQVARVEGEIEQAALERDTYNRQLQGLQFRQRNLEAQGRLLLGV